MCEYKDEQISVQEVDIMKAAVKLLEDDMTFAKGMRGYIAELRKQQESSPAQSQKEGCSRSIPGMRNCLLLFP